MAKMKSCEGFRCQMWGLSSQQASKCLLHLSSSPLGMILAEWLLLGLVSLHGFRLRWEAAGFALAVGLSDGSKIRLGADETEDTGFLQ